MTSVYSSTKYGVPTRTIISKPQEWCVGRAGGSDKFKIGHAAGKAGTPDSRVGINQEGGCRNVDCRYGISDLKTVMVVKEQTGIQDTKTCMKGRAMILPPETGTLGRQSLGLLEVRNEARRDHSLGSPGE